MRLVIRSLKSQMQKAYCFSSKVPTDPLVDETKHNPQQIKELRGHEQMAHMTEYQKSFYPIHSKKRRPFSLYSFFSILPLSVTKLITSTLEHHKTSISGDQFQLPRISENSIPVYQSISLGSTLRFLRSGESIVPIGLVIVSQMPFIIFAGTALIYSWLYKSAFIKLYQSFVIKLQLLPQTEEILYQKIGIFGIIKTSRVRISDLQRINKKQETDLIFNRTTKSIVDKRMSFRIISTGEFLIFDKEGMWHEEGFNHELLI